MLQLAEVMVTRDMFGEMLERIWRLRPVPCEQTLSKCGIVIRSRLPWARYAICRVRFRLDEPFRAFPSCLETLLL